MDVMKNPAYSKPVFNAQCSVSEAKHQDVPYDYNEMTPKEGENRVCVPATIEKVFSSEPDDSEYFTIKGKISMEICLLRLRDGRSKFKEDNTVFDVTGHIQLTMWNTLEYC